MKVYEMKPEEIGEAVLTQDGLIISFDDGKTKRVLIVSNKDLNVSNVRVESIETVKDEPGVKKIRKTSRRKKSSRKELTYLSIKENPVLGKSLNGSLPLNIYKKYGTRLWNNPTRDIMSRVNSAKEDEVDFVWMNSTINGILASHDIKMNNSLYYSYVMYLKGIGLISFRRDQDGKGLYVIHRAPEIPKTIST